MPMNKVPTLLVGLGGIGCSIADMTNAMLTDEERAYVGVVGLDTNVEDLKKLKIKTIRTSDERLVKDYLIQHPEYNEWFPVNKFTVHRGMLTGAGQIRAISRLAALASIEANRFVVLEEEIKRILKHTGDKDNKSFNVFVVGSITGGTGAGMFLQMPFYIREMLKREYSISNIRIRGMFMSADITKNVQPSKINRDAVMVNAYACMKELNAFYLTQIEDDEDNLLSIEYYEKKDRKDEKADVKAKMLKNKVGDEFGIDFFDLDAMQLYEDVDNIASEGANIPYDAFYLIEGTNNTGSIGNASIDTVKMQISKMIFTLLFTPIKAEDAGILDNTILQDMEGGGMNRYSSAGMCSLKYPYNQAREYVNLRWVEDLVSDEWLLLDQRYEEEKKEAQDRQKSDPSVSIPSLAETYVRLFDKESKGGKGCRLAALRNEGYLETEDPENRYISRSMLVFRKISDEIDRIMTQNDIALCASECKVNMKMVSNLDVADKEISRVYSELEQLQSIITNTVEKSRYQIANDVFPASIDSLNMRKDGELCIYEMFANSHPVAARFLCYDILLVLANKIDELETKLSGIDLYEYKDEDFYGTKEDGIQDASQAIAMIRNKNIPVLNTGKKPLKILVSKFQQRTMNQVMILDDYGRTVLELSTYRILRERFSKLAEYYELFFNNIKEQMGKNKVRINLLEKSFIDNPYGELEVYASPEAFRSIYQEFKAKADYELPESTRVTIFNGIYREVCNDLADKNKELSEVQKQKKNEGTQTRLYDLFSKGVEDTLRTIVILKGKGIVDLNIREAIEKQLQLETGLKPNMDEAYERQRIVYERELIERAMRIAAPMFAVQDEHDITETIYMALNPQAAEMSAGQPSKAATKDNLIPERCEATDNQPVSVLMEPEFSKYEIICFKAKHKYLIENLTKYTKDSEYAKAYEERINNLGKEPTGEGADAYKTVVNPHLNRFWHEEGFVPPLGAKERDKSNKDVLKAFVYAMGMDSFVRFRSEEMENRELWYLVKGSYSTPVYQQGRFIGNGYVDLFNSLKFNRRAKKYILYQAKVCMKQIKGFLDADEMSSVIQDTWFIEDLVQSQTLSSEDEDENILNIFLKMYPNMDKRRWASLFEGLKLVLFEYLEYMFDSNAKLINDAYVTILNRMYGYSQAGKKEIARNACVQAQQVIPTELEFKPAEKKLREHMEALLRERYR